MSTYNDGYNDHAPRASVTVLTDTPQAKVTYRGQNGSKFSAIFRQKPNPIGFHARLPGDKPKDRR